MPLLTDHAEMGLQFNLEPLEGALQLFDLCAGRCQSLCLRDHILFYCCDLNRPEKKNTHSYKRFYKEAAVEGWLKRLSSEH